MISDFLYTFKEVHVFFNLFNYISFRAGLSLVFSFTIIILLMPSWINIQLKLFPKGQPIRNDGPKTHLSKEGTPTFGGVLIIFSIILNTIFWSSDFSKFNYILLFTLIVFGLIGFYDDYQKVKFSRGISTKRKFLFQRASKNTIKKVKVFKYRNKFYRINWSCESHNRGVFLPA